MKELITLKDEALHRHITPPYYLKVGGARTTARCAWALPPGTALMHVSSTTGVCSARPC